MKNAKIAIVAMAAILTMMVGYALFSESININGTATAKGEFEFTATCSPGISSELTNEDFLEKSDDFEEYNEGGYNNDTCVVNGNTVSFDTNLEYPSASRKFTIKVTNTGSIPMTPDFGYGAEVDENIEVEGLDYIDASGMAFWGLGMATKDNLEDGAMQPGQSIYLIVSLYWNKLDTFKDIPNARKMALTIKIPFKQAE